MRKSDNLALQLTLIARRGVSTLRVNSITLRGNRLLITLPAPQVLQLSGPDAAAFAQAQFANDVRALACGRWQWNAWLSPQGRVRYLFLLLRVADDRLLLLLRGGDAGDVHKELSRYVLRAKVALEALGNACVLGGSEEDLRHAGLDWPQNDALNMHSGAYALRLDDSRGLVLAPHPFDSVHDSEDDAFARWRLDDIRAGLPELTAPLRDRLLPQWLGLERLPAFSVAKGCYPGQEIIARLHFKGGNKRGLYRLSFGCEHLPAPATPLRTDGTETGLLIQSAWIAPGHAEALAVLGDISPSGAAEALRDIQVVSRFT